MTLNHRAELRRQWRADCEKNGYVEWANWTPSGQTETAPGIYGHRKTTTVKPRFLRTYHWQCSCGADFSKQVGSEEEAEIAWLSHVETRKKPA